MPTLQRIFYRTLSCRTSIDRALSVKRGLMLWVLLGVGLGTVVYCKYPDAAASVWWNHGFVISADALTLWDVFSHCLFPTLIVLVLTLLSACSALGQPAVLALLLTHGIAVGISAAKCFAKYRLVQGLLRTALCILPHGFFSAFLLVLAARDAISLSSKLFSYLIHNSPDPDITQQTRSFLLKCLGWAALLPVSAAMETLCTWLFSI